MNELNQLEYEMGADAYLAYHAYYLRHDPRLRRRVGALRLIISLGLLICGLLLVTAGGVNAVALGVFAILAVAGWILVPQWMHDLSMHIARSRTAPKIRSYTARTTLEDDGLHIWDGEEESVLLYDSIEEIIDEDGYLFLRYGDRQTLVIPPEAFRLGDQKRQEFIYGLQHVVSSRRKGVM